MSQSSTATDLARLYTCLPPHELVVDQLVGVGTDGDVALEGPVKGNDHEQVHAEEACQADDERSLAPCIVRAEEQAEQHAADRTGQEYPPQDPGQAGNFLRSCAFRTDQHAISLR